MEYENIERCKKCGGKCCKKSGCDYFVSDFPVINKQTLIDVLETGNVSIVAALMFNRLENGKIYCAPFLYLRARNIDRGIIDLFSFKKRCSMLTETGCSYDLNHRPGGGVNLFPYDTGVCLPIKNPVDEMKKWEPYQGLLNKLVRRYSGMSVEEQIKKDVEEVFITIIKGDFEGIAQIELQDMFSCITDLMECFPEQYNQAKAKTKNNVRCLNRHV